MPGLTGVLLGVNLQIDVGPRSDHTRTISGTVRLQPPLVFGAKLKSTTFSGSIIGPLARATFAGQRGTMIGRVYGCTDPEVYGIAGIRWDDVHYVGTWFAHSDPSIGKPTDAASQ